MYSLPISTYSDYWRATKVWSSYLGGLAVFVAGTRYSVLVTPDINRTSQPTFQQNTQSSNIDKLETEVSLIDPRKRVFSLGTVSRGVSTQQGEAGHSLSIQGESSLEEASQGSDRISSELVQLKLNNETSVVESTSFAAKDSYQERAARQNPPLEAFVTEAEYGGPLPLIEVGVSRLDKIEVVDKEIQNSKSVEKKKVTIENSILETEENLELAKMNISLTLKVESTAYTYTGNKTATGVEPRHGLIAVDPKVIAMGSKVYVEGYGYAIAADTGGSIHGNRIDVFFPTLRQCIDWGRRSVHIYVLKPI